MRYSIGNKLKGYISHPRQRFILLKSRVLKVSEFVLYEFYLSIAVWDRKKQEKYGTFTITNTAAALELGYKSDATVSQIKNSLIEKKLIVHIEEFTYRILQYENWTTTIPRKIEEHIQNFEIAIQNSETKSQNNETSQLELVSFRGDVGISNGGYSLMQSYKDTRSIDELSTYELYILCKSLFGEGVQVSCGSEVWG